MMPRYPTRAAWILAMLPLLLQPSPLLAQDASFAVAQSLIGSPQHRLQPIVNGHRVQPRRQEMCALLHRRSDCRDGAGLEDDDLLRDILRRSAP